MTAFLAVRVNKGGCGVALATGVFLWLDALQARRQGGCVGCVRTCPVCTEVHLEK